MESKNKRQEVHKMEGFSTIEEALEDLRAGKMLMVTDAEDRENEGDLICAAEFATPESRR